MWFLGATHTPGSGHGHAGGAPGCVQAEDALLDTAGSQGCVASPALGCVIFAGHIGVCPQVRSRFAVGTQ